MTTITKAAQQVIDALQCAKHGHCDHKMADDAIATLRAALQDKAGEVRGSEVGRSGHYFQFERGEWAKNGDEPTKFWPASGLHYVGRLTKDQREGLDKLIRDYLDGTQPAPAVPDGFVLVPVEPTIGMLIAGMEHRISEEQPTHEHAVWAAMLAASQQKGG